MNDLNKRCIVCKTNEDVERFVVSSRECVKKGKTEFYLSFLLCQTHVKVALDAVKKALNL